jgi:hypothetical protein
MILVDWVSTTLAPNTASFSTRYAFYYNTTGANKTSIFNNTGLSLQRLQHTTNAYTATQVHMPLPICAQLPTVAQVSTMVPSST